MCDRFLAVSHSKCRSMTRCNYLAHQATTENDSVSFTVLSHRETELDAINHNPLNLGTLYYIWRQITGRMGIQAYLQEQSVTRIFQSRTGHFFVHTSNSGMRTCDASDQQLTCDHIKEPCLAKSLSGVHKSAR